MAGFQFDKRAMDKIVKDAVQDAAKETQQLLDRLLRTQKGKPVPQVKATLLREWRRSGGKMTDSEATDWATLLSEGRRIVLKPK